MNEPATAHQVEALFRITQNRYRKDEQDLHAFIADCRVKLRGKVPLKEEEVNAIKHIYRRIGPGSRNDSNPRRGAGTDHQGRSALLLRQSGDPQDQAG